ncbi:hypothetical protein Patl1_02330 [Pistacia atlantica]|uniref:Uncharacterized protein n=1 Tax=Pistacia atlantica TaxID=434234 RepID=A0ACC1C7H8_9ROSI|nr:hypothetical protein Patl1_02330 [Pistacia atlantica]
MICFSWNCRGLGNPRTVHELHHWVKIKCPDFVFLIETKCNRNKLEIIRNKIEFSCSFVVDSRGASGGIAMLWKDDKEVDLVSYTQHHISFIVNQSTANQKFILTGFYGHPEALKDQVTSMKFATNMRSSELQIDHLGKWKISGKYLLIVFSVKSISMETSSPGIMAVRARELETEIRKHRPFRYEATWDNRVECGELIQREWLCNLNPNSSLPGVMEGLQRCKEKMSTWSKSAFQSRRNTVTDKLSQMKHLEDSNRGDKKGELQQLKQEIDRLLEEDDIKWKQRAKQQWLKDGDRNIKFFHLCANQRRKSNVIKQISNDEDRSPGPDGFPTIFYQKHWQTIGPSVCSAVREAFCSGSWLQDFNATLITLIPKTIKNLATDYFSIIKCVHSRPLITDNAIVAFEVMHTMNTSLKGKDGYMALKLDMSKAYDRLEWSFLQAVMRKMSFCSTWIKVIMNCLSSVSYSVLINGIPQKPFKPSRGIRQGDPLSPYLFIIGAEALSRLIQDSEDRRDIKGVPMGRSRMRISHLFYADDCLLFCKANQYEWNGLFKLLDTYEKNSGQRLNKEKTLIFFSKNTRDDVKQQIIQVAGVKSSHPYDIYLGLRTLIGRDNTRGFKHILECVRGKLSNWKMKYLSQAGKETLLKAVIQALPTYSMGVFKIPKTILQELNRLIKSYWWGQKNDERRIHRCSWDKMKLSNNDGGLGFRDLELFNLAMLAKQG